MTEKKEKKSFQKQLVLNSALRLYKMGEKNNDGGQFFTPREVIKVMVKIIDLWCVVSLPPKAFVNAGAASKTNLLFFTRGEPTKKIWYYDLFDLNITKKQPLTGEHFDDFFEHFDPSTHELSDSERSWCVPVEDIQAKNYDLKAVNPNRKGDEDFRTPEELLTIIESQAEEIGGALSVLRRNRRG